MAHVLLAGSLCLILPELCVAAEHMPFSRAELKATREVLAATDTAVWEYALENTQSSPESLEDLTRAPRPLLKQVPTDPWGSPIQYRRRPTEELWSLGPDKKEGGGDDISTWDIPDELRFSTRRGNAEAERQRRLEIIGAAMLKFHDLYHTYPLVNGNPATISEENGLSWRVHLLPLIGEKDLYRQFKLDEPWDSPHNRQLVEKLPEVYQLSRGLPAGHTTIHLPTCPLKRPPHELVAFRDLETVRRYGDDAATAIRDLTDRATETILVVVCGKSHAKPWTMPADLPIDLASPSKSLGDVRGGLAVIMGDCKPRLLVRNVTDELLRALFTARANDEIPGR